MSFNFDIEYDRASYHSSKWLKYENRDVLPFWIADMDFATPDFVREAVQERLVHPLLGYTDAPEELNEVFVAWAANRFGWQIQPEWLLWISAIVPGMNVTLKTLGNPGDECICFTPTYPPFLQMPEFGSQALSCSPLALCGHRWEMDFDDLRQRAKGATNLLLSNPQNPTGRMYSRAELEELAAICLAQNVRVLSDEIHWGIGLNPDCEHVPIASLDPAIEANTVTFFSHTKTYNIAGLQSAVAVVPNAEDRASLTDAFDGWPRSISPLALAATLAAYQDDSTWLSDLSAYLRTNAGVLYESVAKTKHFQTTPIEGTHLAWLDARALPVRDPAAYLEAFGLGLSDGVDFGTPGFVRFNFATPRSLLRRGLERLHEADQCSNPTPAAKQPQLRS